MRVKYFAWVRERVGKGEEEIVLPADVVTVADLVAHLSARGEEYAHAFADARVVRAALDRRHVPVTADVRGASEIAFFPPMTGG